MCYGSKHLPLVGYKQKNAAMRRFFGLTVAYWSSANTVCGSWLAVQALQYQPAQ